MNVVLGACFPFDLIGEILAWTLKWKLWKENITLAIRKSISAALCSLRCRAAALDFSMGVNMVEDLCDVNNQLRKADVKKTKERFQCDTYKRNDFYIGRFAK